MISIVTPTYNRSAYLPRLYESLINQSNQNFEWIIIDDGSNDDTNDVVNNFISDKFVTIKYHKKQNGGKHTAINHSLNFVSTNWVFIVDSDDCITDDAVETIINNLNSDLIGLSFRKSDFNGRISGKLIDDLGESQVISYKDATNLFKGELALIFNADLMKKHKFPEFAGEKLIPESCVWNQISKNGDIRFFNNKSIYIFEYLQDGYTMNFKKNFTQNPKGFCFHYKQKLYDEKHLIEKLKCSIRIAQCFFNSKMKQFSLYQI